MSTWVLLSGHNFSQASMRVRQTAKEAGNVVVAFDTSKTILVPSYLAEVGAEEAYMAFNGMEPAKGEKVVVSAKHDDIIALMAVDSGIANVVEEELAGRFVYTSPLLEIMDGGKRAVNILLTKTNAYVTVLEKGLRFAEVLPESSPDSVLYYLQVLGKEFKLRKFTINIGGEGASEAVAAVAGYFKNVKIAGTVGVPTADLLRR